MRKPNSNITRQTLTWNHQDQRKRGIAKTHGDVTLGQTSRANGAELETTGDDRPGQEMLERMFAWHMLQEVPRFYN